MDSSRRTALATLVSLPLMFSASAAFADTGFDQIVSDVRAEAVRRGVSDSTLRRALTDVKPLTEVRQFETSQPERSRTVTFSDYYSRHVSANALEQGRQFRRAHAQSFERAERDYGVPASVILAILNIESRYGANTGNQKIVPALLTLVRDVQGDDRRAQERRALFREEAVQALMLVDEGYEEILTGSGSWAGAVGPAQFMPSSIRLYGVDANKDGKKDLWRNYDDIILSVANYLKEKGWRTGERWGRKVSLPPGFDKELLTDTLPQQVNKTPDEWAALGIRLAEGGTLPQNDSMRAMIIAPDYNVKTGHLKGPVYMVYDNFRTAMEYNKSYKYALTVLHMADLLGHAPAAAPSPPDSYNQ